MMLKIWSVLPDMYIIIAFMGRDLAGARAISQDFFNLSVSVSARAGGERADFWSDDLLLLLLDER